MVQKEKQIEVKYMCNSTRPLSHCLILTEPAKPTRAGCQRCIIAYGYIPVHFIYHSTDSADKCVSFALAKVHDCEGYWRLGIQEKQRARVFVQEGFTRPKDAKYSYRD